MKEWLHNEGSIKVLVTTAHVGALVRQVGGDHVVVLELIQGASDPHSYQLVKGDDEKFQVADVVFYSGLGLEHSPSIVQQLEASHAIAIGNGIADLDPSAPILLGSTIDPHIWMDVSLWAKGAFVVSKALSQIAPDKSAVFERNANGVYKRLMDLDAKVRHIMEEIPAEKRFLVTTHDAFHYFARRYLAAPDDRNGDAWRIRCKAPEGLAPESQISTQDILDIAQYIVTYHIPVLFAEVGINQDSLIKLREVVLEGGHEIAIVDEELYSDSMGEEGTPGETYEGMIWHNATVIRNHLFPSKSSSACTAIESKAKKRKEK